MSTEQKYYMTNKQIDCILSLNRSVSIYGPIFTVFVSLLIMNLITGIMNINKYSNILIVVFGLCSLISGSRLYSTIKDKKELLQKIRETAHYEIKINEKS